MDPGSLVTAETPDLRETLYHISVMVTVREISVSLINEKNLYRVLVFSVACRFLCNMDVAMHNFFSGTKLLLNENHLLASLT